MPLSVNLDLYFTCLLLAGVVPYTKNHGRANNMQRYFRAVPQQQKNASILGDGLHIHFPQTPTEVEKKSLKFVQRV